MTVIEHLLKHKLVAILRGVEPSRMLDVMDALWRGGFRSVEITLNSGDALHGIRKASQRLGGKLLVGAGTVLDAASALSAMDAGAEFLISPNFDAETIAVTKASGKVSIPGAFTATEIVNAFKAGGDIIKVFPASNPPYIKSLKGPLSHIPIMATGRVDISNLRQYQQAGAVLFGIGSALVNSKQAITDSFLQELEEKSVQLVKALE